MKSIIQNVRISQKLKEKLTNTCSKSNCSVSSLIRDILNEYYNDSRKKEIDDLFGPEYFNSSEFIFLISWIQEKRVNPYDNNSLRTLKFLKGKTILAITDKHLPDDLKREFEKVLIDLARFITEFGTVNNNHFRFCLPNHSGSFNYSLLANYIEKKGFENTLFL